MRLKVFHEVVWKSYPAKSYEEYTYEWLGEPHASVSVRYDTNGNEIARNLASNPSFERSAEDGWIKGSRVGFGSTTASPDRVHVGERSRVLRWDDDATEIQSVVYVPVDVVPGDWVAISAWIATNSGNALFARPVISEYTNDNSTYISHNYQDERQRLLQEEMAQLIFAYQVTAQDVETARAGIVFSNGLSEYQSPTGYAYLDAVNIAVADSESTALAQVETYFDGDTPPDRAWVDFQPRNISGIKRIWPRSSTPPPAGTSYEWAGEPHASESIKRVDGVEVARNLVTNPHFERRATDLSAPYGSVSWDDSMLVITSTAKDSAARLEKRFTLDTLGQYTWTVYALFPESISRVIYQIPVGVQHPNTVIEVGDGWNKYSITFTVTEPGDKRLRLYLSDINPGEQMMVDWELLTPGILTTYFDGDTPSDRHNDLWYNQDGVPHEWVNGKGWVAI